MLRTIHLHGRLGKQFARKYTLDCATPAEAIRALLYMVPGMRTALSEGSYTVRVVNRQANTYLDDDMLHLDIADAPAIHITPVVAGRGKGGAKAILGFLLIVVAIALPGGLLVGGGLFTGGTLTAAGTLAAFGAAVMLSGIAMMLSPIPKMGKFDEEREASFLFDGVENTYEQGVPVPVVYGRHLTGSVTVSAGIAVEDILAGSTNPWNDFNGPDFFDQQYTF